jgi:carbon-monoxide dehydrogenase medium subunit
VLRPFRIHEPATADEASRLLAEHGPEAAAYAGGTELLLLMKADLVRVGHLVNLKTIPGLNGIAREDGTLVIGSLVTHRQLERSDLLRQHLPVLAELEAGIANVRVRAAGTLGGNLCFAEPHSDPATFLLAWGAELVLTSAAGRREVAVGDFFVDALETVRRPHEILTEVRVPLLPPTVRCSYQRFRLHERPTATLAARLDVRDGTIGDARLSIGSVSPVPVRAPAAEAILHGQRPGEEAFAAAAAEAAGAVDPVDDMYGSVEYKRHLVGVLTRRALATAAGETAGDPGP